MPRELSIGQVATRTGIAVSAIRFYEAQGLVSSNRNRGGQRRFHPEVIRRITFIQVAQKFGFTINRISELLSTLPNSRTPNQKDWEKIANSFRAELDAQIRTLEKLRNNLDGCIGCGCLLMDRCKLYNPDDILGQEGSGARLLIDQ